MSILKETAISEVMSKNILVTDIDDTIESVIQKMSRINVGSALVLKNKELTGIVTERDILHWVGKNDTLALKKTISSIMSKEVISLEVNQSLETAGELMSKNYFRHLPITDNGKVVGLLSARDIFGVFRRQDIIKIKQLKAIKSMAITYAHEINNPLYIISGSLEIVKKDFHHDKLDMALKNVNRISNVIKKISRLKELNEIKYSNSGQSMFELFDFEEKK